MYILAFQVANVKDKPNVLHSPMCHFHALVVYDQVSAPSLCGMQLTL